METFLNVLGPRPAPRSWAVEKAGALGNPGGLLQMKAGGAAPGVKDTLSHCLLTSSLQSPGEEGGERLHTQDLVQFKPSKVTRLLEVSLEKMPACSDVQFEINAGNVCSLPTRGLCCPASWVIVTFNFRTLTCASSNEQKPNHTASSLGGPTVSEVPRVLVSTASCSRVTACGTQDA